MAAIPELDRSIESAYREHYPALIRRARRWLPPHEAEDLVQETFLRAWTHHGGSSPGVPWLMTVLRNLAIDRSRRIQPELTDDPASLENGHGADETAEKVVALEDRRRVREALASLTSQQRAVITLREWAGMTQQEIADSLGTTVPSVESLLLRGRRRLKKSLSHALAALLWPTSELGRKLKGIAGQQAVGGPAAVSSWSSAVAGLATAATVVAAGVAAPLGPSDPSGPPPRDRVVAESSAVPAAGPGIDLTTPTERAAGSGSRPPGHTGGGLAGTTSSGSTTSGSTTLPGPGSSSDEEPLEPKPAPAPGPAAGTPNIDSGGRPSGTPSSPQENGEAEPGEGPGTPVVPPETSSDDPGRVTIGG